jgi:cation diffusion facilitator family transporter
VLTSTLGSVALAAGLLAVHVAFESHLALAQAADSLSDVFTATALLFSMRIALAPPDASHPTGHQRAEPIAALVAAVLAGVLAVEVLRDAVTAILTGAVPELGWPLVAMFAVKVVFKSGIALAAAAQNRRRASPAVGALAVDARMDVAVGLLAVVGYFAALFGRPGLDAWLAVPVALWIGWSGIALASENIKLLMGQAPPESRRGELMAAACEVPGVRSVHNLVARYHGTELDVLLHVVVDPELTVRAAHDIGHAVEARLLAEDDVCQAIAHVDVEIDEPNTDARVAEREW